MTERKPQTPNLPRRFYKEAAVSREGDTFAILLDGKPVRTPQKNHLATTHETLANLIAAEWDAQGELIDPTTMPLTRLLNVSIDGTPGARDAMADEVAKYTETDLVCHLAEGPSELRARQEAGWGHWRQWAGKSFDIVLVPVEGIIASPQPDASLKAARAHAASLDDLRLTALTWAMALYGSAVLALAVEQGELDALDAFDLSRIDETWQIEQWGEDEEAAAIAEARRQDARALGRFFATLSS